MKSVIRLNPIQRTRLEAVMNCLSSDRFWLQKDYLSSFSNAMNFACGYLLNFSIPFSVVFLKVQSYVRSLFGM